MKHKKVKKLLFHYLMDSLPGDLRKKMDTHMDECETCRKERDYLRGIMTDTKAGEPFQLPDHTFEKAKQLVRAEYEKDEPTVVEKMKKRWTPFKTVFQPSFVVPVLVLVILLLNIISHLSWVKIFVMNLPFSLFQAFDIF